MRRQIFSLGLLLCATFLSAQSLRDYYPETLVDTNLPAKIEHAEPLYIDLIRDLGARKGEKEWNVGFGLIDHLDYDVYEALIEYEWAVADRLGLEVEVPVTIYSMNSLDNQFKPSNRVESLKLAGQWTFLVNPKSRTSLALGYINEFEFEDLDKISSSNVFRDNVFNPFIVAAQRLGRDWHSLLYTGPNWKVGFHDGHISRGYEAHVNLHYMIPHTSNFVGIETNMNWQDQDFRAVLRPQMRLNISDEVKAGMVVGVPIDRSDERLSFFIRLIWEPGSKSH